MYKADNSYLETLQKSITVPKTLPIADRAEELAQLIENNQILIVRGETGSGKSTQLPKILLKTGLAKTGRIAVTQPRRIAATSLAARIKEECNDDSVASAHIRFYNDSKAHTPIVFMTDGIMLKELVHDRLLSEYNAVIIDEAHERSLNIDMLLALIQDVLEKRQEFKVIITSATLRVDLFAKTFPKAPLIEVSGKMFPVETIFLGSGEVNLPEECVSALDKIQQSFPIDNTLVFLPTEQHIRETQELLQQKDFHNWEIFPLYGRMPIGKQQQVFQPGEKPRIILATNIAETSITVPGIRYVVDSGLARHSMYDPRSRITHLPIDKIPQSQCLQRKGRAGRVKNGIYFALFDEQDYASRDMYEKAEILRSSLSTVLLQCSGLGVSHIDNLRLIEKPNLSAIIDGYKELEELGLVIEQDQEFRLTEIGKKAVKLPLDPSIAVCIFRAEQYGVLDEVLPILAMLSTQDPRERPQDEETKADAAHKKFLHIDSDFMTFLNIHKEYRKIQKTKSVSLRSWCKKHYISHRRMREIQDIYLQLKQLLRDLHIRIQPCSGDTYSLIHRCLIAGMSRFIGKKTEGNKNTYQFPRGKTGYIFPGSGLFSQNQNGYSRLSW
jgi:ATP-dependent helicase HrpA